MGDPTFTTETTVGGPIYVTLAIDNSGSQANPSTEMQFGGITDYADIVGCNPTCTVSEFLGDIYAEVGGLPAGATSTIEVEFIATAIGAPNWSVCIYDDSGGEQIYCGSGTTVIR